MNAKRTLFALHALLAAALACNLPRTLSTTQPPTSPSAITAPAGPLAQSSPTTVSTTATTTLPLVSVTVATDCRAGPGAPYGLLFSLQLGQTAQVVGKDTPDHYWVIKMPGGDTCWLDGQSAVVTGNAIVLPEIPTPTIAAHSLPAAPSGFRVSFHCSPTNSPFPHNEVHVEISWDDNAADVVGYYLFRDGRLLATLRSSVTSFSDNTTMAALVLAGQSPPVITYAIQAFNGVGTSKKVSKSISCFG